MEHGLKLLVVVLMVSIGLVVLRWTHSSNTDSGQRVSIDDIGSLSLPSLRPVVEDSKIPFDWNISSSSASSSASPSLSRTTEEEGLRFLVLGDWGSGTSGVSLAILGPQLAMVGLPQASPSSPPFDSNVIEQLSVATEFTAAAELLKPHFILSTGDQFYGFGVTSVSDPQFQDKFERIYTSKALMVPWYLTAGNHDCLGNMTALVDYSTISSRWHMPGRWFSVDHRITVDADGQPLIAR